MTRHGDVRQKILDAAEQRLWHYGFKKTTIDEIASDAGVGKGTVYLYFDGKEDIGLAIVANYKETSLREIEAIAGEAGKTPAQKLKEMLQHPVVVTHQKCQASPAMLEMIVAIKPHIRAHIQPFTEREYALLAQVLDEGNATGVFDVEEPLRAARTLKSMTNGFLPPSLSGVSTQEIMADISEIVDLTVRGLRKQ